jgi:hypothetical protein
MEGSGHGLNLRYYTGICLERFRKTTIQLSQEVSGPRCEPATFEYEAGILFRDVRLSAFFYGDSFKLDCIRFNGKTCFKAESDIKSQIVVLSVQTPIKPFIMQSIQIIQNKPAVAFYNPATQMGLKCLC